ncbi:MAG: heavy metal translocating P-type ATPase [Mariniblastus sp.]|nr:heavy metal translocating P-type ATPase [Mariniblastus sp.]
MEKEQPKLKPHSHSHACAHSGVFGERTELIFAILSGVFLCLSWLLSFLSVPFEYLLPIYILSYFFGGYYTFIESLNKLKLQQFEIDFLMLVAAIGAAVLGNWSEGALLLFLFSLSHSLEHVAMGKARNAIESLANLAPDIALVRRNHQELEVLIDKLEIGDTVIVKPNERVAADGFVVKGQTSIDQSPITGESLPVEKSAVNDPQWAKENEAHLPFENRVFAGTINQHGAIEILVTRLATETALARVVVMVNEAENQQSETQRFAQRFERTFVPVVLICVGALLFAWIFISETAGESFYRAMAVLVAASPCALAISTPSAVLSGVARAARGGVLIKGGGPLEELGKIKSIAFDKTGTLTEGKPSVTDVVTANGVSETELLVTAVSVERLSDHPLAAALVRDAVDRLPAQLHPSSPSFPSAENLVSKTGQGVTASLNENFITIGKSSFFSSPNPSIEDQVFFDSVANLERQGRTVIVVKQDDRFLGFIGLMDTPRAGAKKTITRLREIGIESMSMLSGDNQNVANAIAQSVGVNQAFGNLMPADKVEKIKLLQNDGPVGMVGDGVNDAPAMATANVGIAMGAAGSDVALETADIALMSDDLEKLPFAIGLSKMTKNIIIQNLWISLGMIAFLVPATVFGLQIGPAVILHEGSTFIVVLNALRLLGFNETKRP